MENETCGMAGIFCPNCGDFCPKGVRYCKRCGERLWDCPENFQVTGISSDELQAGSYVIFGRYPQKNRNTAEPVEWKVLENDGATALITAKYGLDCKPFHNESASISWRDCDLRKWQNCVFLGNAFNDEELIMIAWSKIITNDNPDFGAKGCGETQDKVFCLSIDEAKKYFESDEARKCGPTAYAVSRDAYRVGNGGCWFWLRSPGNYTSHAAVVDGRGAVRSGGDSVGVKSLAVRPALRIIL
ncbi:MAG: DUF6273 domain-containing protein [bacterium]|nr:DUF6273 domain-containing protein [bacterium]